MQKKFFIYIRGRLDIMPSTIEELLDKWLAENDLGRAAVVPYNEWITPLINKCIKFNPKAGLSEREYIEVVRRCEFNRRIPVIRVNMQN
jgi:hypothetical protein